VTGLVYYAVGGAVTGLVYHHQVVLVNRHRFCYQNEHNLIQ